MRPKLTYANVISTLCLFLLLGGGAAFAASQLGKNSVGTKQIKKNAVRTGKIAPGAIKAGKIAKSAVVTNRLKNDAVTAAKVKDGTLTGTQINASTLGIVPTAEKANSLSPGEAWHVLGAPGEPGFLNGWSAPKAPSYETPGFYKDHEGIVHLKGFVEGGTGDGTIFLLPPGYRPASHNWIAFSVYCIGGECEPAQVDPAVVFGPGLEPGRDGAVIAASGAVRLSLNGIDFRAES